MPLSYYFIGGLIVWNIYLQILSHEYFGQLTKLKERLPSESARRDAYQTSAMRQQDLIDQKIEKLASILGYYWAGVKISSRDEGWVKTTQFKKRKKTNAK